MLRLVQITKMNIQEALEIEHKIFPRYSARANYYDSLDDNSNANYFLVYSKADCVGITGLYSYSNDKENGWLAFFGLKEEFRGQGIGREMLELSEEYARSRGFINLRLFTDKYDNLDAINFYKHCGFTFEDYNCNKEELKDMFKVVIGSKSLVDKKVPKWGNKFLNITKQIIKQEC